MGRLNDGGRIRNESRVEWKLDQWKSRNTDNNNIPATPATPPPTPTHCSTVLSGCVWHSHDADRKPAITRAPDVTTQRAEQLGDKGEERQ